MEHYTTDIMVNVVTNQSIFSDAEEKSILTAVIKCGDWGFPLTLMDLR